MNKQFKKALLTFAAISYTGFAVAGLWCLMGSYLAFVPKTITVILYVAISISIPVVFEDRFE
jgi:hypothetical protein